MSFPLPIVLGSSSKFRRRLLDESGIPVASFLKIDEKSVGCRDTMTPEDLTILIAKEKAKALIPEILEPSLLITSDQVVVYDGRIREKPETEEECKKYLRSYAIHPAETVSAVVVTNTGTGKQCLGVDRAKQHFKDIPEQVMSELISKGDVMHCCGGFMIDDPILYPYLGRREGDEDSIIGMPLKLTRRLLEEASR
ncbi:inosine triphosphate pyrophosphatase-like protein [Paraphysoderma sedebokerense]|nr:inosine triphosphate pyrophosphatase-like protein [Paraphysoderma sedebokerense]